MTEENSNKRVAVFDFCETLVDFQTANAFVDYVRRNTNYTSVKLLNFFYVLLVKSQAVKLLHIITRHKISIGKHIKLWQLCGIKQQTIEMLSVGFYEQCIKPHLIDETIGIMKQLQSDGYVLGLSSGGYDIYLRLFVKDFGLDFCQSSEIDFKNGRCTGRMKDNDCMRNEKVLRLNKSFGKSLVSSVAYSDSKSDLPLLLWAEHGVVVSRNTHQKWCEKYNLQEIIWHKK
jgi:HAD superfamily hydrolase (TIGR01490 family)